MEKIGNASCTKTKASHAHENMGKEKFSNVRWKKEAQVQFKKQVVASPLDNQEKVRQDT